MTHLADRLVRPPPLLQQVDAGFRSPLRTGIEIAGTDGTIVVRQPWRPEGLPVLLTRGSDTDHSRVRSVKDLTNDGPGKNNVDDSRGHTNDGSRHNTRG